MKARSEGAISFKLWKEFPELHLKTCTKETLLSLSKELSKKEVVDELKRREGLEHTLRRVRAVLAKYQGHFDNLDEVSILRAKLVVAKKKIKEVEVMLMLTKENTYKVLGRLASLEKSFWGLKIENDTFEEEKNGLKKKVFKLKVNSCKKYSEITRLQSEVILTNPPTDITEKDLKVLNDN